MTQGFQLARVLLQHGDLMRDCDVGKVRVDGFYNLIIIRTYTLELEIKVIQAGDKLHLRGVVRDDDELLAKDSFDDKTAPVMLQSGLAEQLVETDILLLIEPERILVTWCFGLLCSFLVGIHSFRLKGVRLGRTPRPRRARTFVGQNAVCRTKVHLAPIWRWEKSAPESFCQKFCKSSVAASGDGAFPDAILQPLGAEKKPDERTGADWSGHRNQGISGGYILRSQ